MVRQLVQGVARRNVMCKIAHRNYGKPMVVLGRTLRLRSLGDLRSPVASQRGEEGAAEVEWRGGDWPHGRRRPLVSSGRGRYASTGNTPAVLELVLRCHLDPRTCKIEI